MRKRINVLQDASQNYKKNPKFDKNKVVNLGKKAKIVQGQSCTIINLSLS